MKKIAIALLAPVVGAVVLPLAPSSAEAQIRPAPPIRATPTFKCSATVSGGTGLVTIEKTNAVAVDKDKDIVAVVNTPNGKVNAAVCGSAFAGKSVGTKGTTSFTPPATKDTSWVYTCRAAVADTSLACNLPR
jgi:hypothetical protein